MTHQLELSTIKRNWIEQNIPTVLNAVRGMVFFNSDTVHAIVPEPEEPNWVGCLFAKLRNEGKITKIGYVTSTRPSANGKIIAQWKAV